MTPFGLEDRLAVPPAAAALAPHGKYANDYNEVKALGRVDSPFRPQDRTDVARFYAAASPVPVWPAPRAGQRRAGQDALGERAGSSPCWRWPWATPRSRRWDTKYHYNFWRPVTAIRAGDTDGNPQDRPGSGLASR